MKSYIRPSLIIISFFIFFIVSGCTQKEAPKKVSLLKRAGDAPEKVEKPQPNTLWFGFDFRLGPKEEVSIYNPFLQYLERATGRRFRIKFTQKYEDTVDNLGRGLTDFAAIDPMSYVRGAKEYGIRYLVSGVNREGDPTYHSVIFTKPESTIKEIRDIAGKCFAFGSEISTQGHLIPRKMLEDEGITIEDLGKHIYTGSHVQAVKSVLNGECDAGGIQDTLASGMAAEGKIRILKISGPFPSSVIAYHNAVDTDIVEAVRAALLAFEPRGAHREVLVDWDKTEMPLGFSKIDEIQLNKVMSLAESYGLFN